MVSHLMIDKANDIHPYQILFPNLETLFFNDCDKNTHYYWSTRYPNISLLIMRHLCEPSLVHELVGKTKEGKLHIVFNNYYMDGWIRYGGSSKVQEALQTNRILAIPNSMFELLQILYKKPIPMN